MADASGQATSSNPDAIRIRDNQRRSRARRKEYLADLEAKVRTCQMQGVQATSEMQTIARRVADENRSLRQLLEEYGVPSNTVEDRVLQSQNIPEAESPSGQLEHMLGRRHDDVAPSSRTTSVADSLVSGLGTGNLISPIATSSPMKPPPCYNSHLGSMGIPSASLDPRNMTHEHGLHPAGHSYSLPHFSMPNTFSRATPRVSPAAPAAPSRTTTRCTQRWQDQVPRWT